MARTVRVPKAFRRDTEIRSRPLQAKLKNFLMRLARLEVKRAKDSGMLGPVAVKQIRKSKVPIMKAAQVDVAELAEFLRVFGLRRLDAAGKKTASATGAKWVARPQAVTEFLSSKDIRVREFLDDTNKQFAEAIRVILLEAAAETPQPTTNAIARRLFQRVTSEGAMSPARAERIARTETAQSENAGIHEGYIAAGIKKMKWVAKLDFDTRSSHRKLHGTVTEVGTPWTFTGVKGGSVSLRYPGDPFGPPEEIIHCFPADCLVQGRVSSAFRFKYVGPMLRISTRSGRELTVTPNHPILTDAGFRPASSLELGHDVFRYGREIELPVSTRIVDDEQNQPSAIEEIFDALGSRGSGVSREVTIQDFDGDGSRGQGQVNVVGAGGELLDERQADAEQRFRHLILELANVGLTTPSRHRPLLLDLGSLLGPPSSLPPRPALPLDRSPIEIEGGPFQPLRFGSASELDAPRYEPGARTDSGDAGFVSQLLERGSGLISRDQVVEVRDFAFSGHVFDVESPFGWVIADGVLSSNCRCTSIPVIEKRKRR